MGEYEGNECVKIEIEGEGEARIIVRRILLIKNRMSG
jgi:hypothetical protein